MEGVNPIILGLDSYFRRLVPSSAVPIEVTQRYFKPVTIRRNDYVLRQGSPVRPILYVHNGYFRLFREEPDGSAFTRAISTRGKFLVDVFQFMGDGLAQQNIQAITDCEIAMIHREDIHKLYEEHPGFKDIEIKLLEDVVIQLAKRNESLLTLNADYRYKKLMRDHPDLIRSVPVKDIASLLGITPQSLSRLRSSELKGIRNG